jgi:hypothetical protein
VQHCRQTSALLKFVLIFVLWTAGMEGTRGFVIAPHRVLCPPLSDLAVVAAQQAVQAGLHLSAGLPIQR